MKASPSIPQLMSICASPTMIEATSKAAELNWQPVPDERLEEWRERFTSDGREVHVVAWQQTDREGADSLAFWIAPGPGGHRSCYYSTSSPDGLLEALTEQFGTPANLDKHDLVTTAIWAHDSANITFSQIGSSAVVNFAKY